MFKRLVVMLSAVTAMMIAGSVAAQAVSGTLARIKSANAINVAYSAESPPFSFNGPGNSPTGFSIDLCQRVIAQIGREVGNPNLKVNWIPGSVTERLQMVASGRADLECANTTQTLSRLASVDFSNLTFVDAGGFLVKAGSPINRITDLAGKRIVVRKGTTTETRLRDVLNKRLVNATVVTIDNAMEGLTMLESGSVDAYAADKVALVGLAAQSKDPSKLALVAEEISFEPYAMAMPRNDSAMRLAVNTALTQVYQSSEIDRIYARWLGRLGRPSDLLTMLYFLNSIPQ